MSGDPDRDQKVGSGSINENQFKSFDNFMRAFYKVYPGGQAFGHADTDDKGKTDPGFDVEDYVFNKFGKQNTTLGNEKAKSRAELVNTPPHWSPQVRVRT